MTVKEIKEKLKEYNDLGKKIFITSSFQTHSIPLLHIISEVNIPVDVLFINTGFHFPETIKFANELVSKLGLNLINVIPLIPKNLQKDQDNQFYFISDPDYCCFINKTQPLDTYLMKYDIWVNGVRRGQSEVRKRMKTEQEAPHDTMRFHPILDWTPKEIYEYRIANSLPEHPMEKDGYFSIGCAPCTRKTEILDERSARWFGMNKTECGLHTDLIKN